MGIPRHAVIALAVWMLGALAFAQEFPTNGTGNNPRIAAWGASRGTYSANSTIEATVDSSVDSDSFSSHSPFYPDTGFNSVVDTNGWPVAMPFSHYPQGMVNEDGTGIYECLLPVNAADECFCTPPPCYFGTLYVSGVVLDRRTNLRPAGLIYDATFTTELANTSDFNFETEAGFRLGLWLAHPCGIDWNFEYFNVGNFEDTVSRDDAANVNAIFFGGAFATAPTSITAEYGSDLDSLELTVRARQWPRLAPLVGFRILQVEEEFNLLSDVSARTGLFSTTDNELYGVQFGFQGLLYQWPRARLEATVKAGTYYNDIDVEANALLGTTATTFTHSPNWSAFSGDVKVTWVWQLGPRANFRIGYQALWLDGIALAVNQNTERSFSPIVQTIDISDALYQGGEIGFDISW